MGSIQVIESIEIWNFQSHKHILVEFSRTISTIVGENDSGKTAILRALQLASHNRVIPKMVRDDSPFTKILLKVDGHKIVRKKGDGVNLYKLDGKVFKAFGTTVPEEIANLLNLSDASFQNQLDNPFWFCDSAGQVSKQLNQIINLGAIDTSLSYVASELREARTAVSISQQRLDEAKSHKKELAWVPMFNKELEELEEKEKELTQKRFSLQEISSIMLDTRTCERNLGGALQLKEKGNKATRTYASLREAEEKRVALDEMLYSIQEAEGEVCQTGKEVTRIHSELEEVTRGKCPVCGKKLT